MNDDQALRRKMADALEAAGKLQSPAWRRAVEAVPRHEFLRGGFFETVPGVSPTSWAPVMPDAPGWLERCYADESLVTQIAGTIVPGDLEGRISRAPTSSSTMPGLVVRMDEDLLVEDGMRVLEIGTGTGYSTALLCERLGEDLVTSVEVDADVAMRARNALAAVGYHPELVVGDGLAGHKDGAPYDRLIATCGITTIPQAWIEQVRPGGLIVATVCGWLYSSELARLTVQRDGTATGRLLGGQISFMLARPQSPPPLGMLPDLDAGEERPTTVGADLLGDWTARFVMQLATPRVQRLDLPRNGRTEHVLLDVDAGAWAAVYADGAGWLVRQGGPYRVWDLVEERIGLWQVAGQPDLSEFRISVADGQQTVFWPS
ncbi:ATP-grasp peptide maturase system methyltransferase [Streptacidiphilus melanogenes]|uniref:ATP-grasp peptide maturase system methyltransferase n=1 Tax=Streptacidiphilus melanogenes TaxID=411235 RepID=UPI0005A76479|nr:ATP-grasp peptide maturase system methyltransferase [Streptacidiphilus melanogenes]